MMRTIFFSNVCTLMWGGGGNCVIQFYFKTRMRAGRGPAYRDRHRECPARGTSRCLYDDRRSHFLLQSGHSQGSGPSSLTTRDMNMPPSWIHLRRFSTSCN